MCIGLARLSVPAGQADQISLAIAEEGQLFFPAGLAERDVGAGVDQARVGVCGDASVAESVGLAWGAQAGAAAY